MILEMLGTRNVCQGWQNIVNGIRSKREMYIADRKKWRASTTYPSTLILNVEL